MYNEFMEFYDWIYGKFIEWRGTRRVGLTDFANYAGVSQSLMSQYMNPDPSKRKKPRDNKTISRLVSVFGNEVYEVLGMPSSETSALLDSLPPGVQSRLVAALTEAQQMASASGINLDSPKGSDIVNSVLRKHGL
jgi:hypothetical protein